MRPHRRTPRTTVAPSLDPLEVRALLASDFGDAPAPYPVTLAEDGARHIVGVSSPRFGPSADTEADGTHSALADADGADENGISLPAIFYAGRTFNVTFDVRNAVQVPKIDAWIDFNADGDWSDAGEQIFDSISVAQADLLPRSVEIPGSASIGYTFARFRISSAGNLAPTGEALDGEVQDYRIFVGFPWPELTSPAQGSDVNVTGTNRVTLNWGAVTGAVNYDVWINYGNQNQWHRATVAGTTYTPNVDFPVGIYHMYIRSLGANGLTSAWSPVRDFQVVAKTTLNPIARDQNTFRPTISWAPIPGNPQYKVWISDLVNNQQVLLAESLTTNSFTPATDLPRGSYRVWVSMQTPELWSIPVDFRIAVSPQPTNGVNSTFNRQQTFGWSPAAGSAVSYDFQLRNRNTGAVVVNATDLTTNSYTPLSDLADGPYRWWVRAKLAGNIYTLWSAPTDVFVGGRTDVLTPSGTGSNTTPTFSWRPVTGTVRYELWVVRNNSSLVINKTDITTTAYTPPTTLATGTYRIWVRAVSAGNELSPWSLPVSYFLSENDSNVTPSLEVAPFLDSALITALNPQPIATAVHKETSLSNSPRSTATHPEQHQMEKAMQGLNQSIARTVAHEIGQPASTEAVEGLEPLDVVFLQHVTNLWDRTTSLF